MELYVAEESVEWRSTHRIIGVFDSQEKARKSLETGVFVDIGNVFISEEGDDTCRAVGYNNAGKFTRIGYIERFRLNELEHPQ